MKKAILLLIAIVLIYYADGIYNAYVLENLAEKAATKQLSLISNPWDENELRKHASWWLLNKSNLKPERITNLATQELGNFVTYKSLPDCYLKMGTDSYSFEKHTYAICESVIEFKNKTANLEVRFILENEKWKINDFISLN